MVSRGGSRSRGVLTAGLTTATGRVEPGRPVVRHRPPCHRRRAIALHAVNPRATKPRAVDRRAVDHWEVDHRGVVGREVSTTGRSTIVASSPPRHPPHAIHRHASTATPSTATPSTATHHHRAIHHRAIHRRAAWPPSEIIWARFCENFSTSLPRPPRSRPGRMGRPAVTFIDVWMRTWSPPRTARASPGWPPTRYPRRGLLAGRIHHHTRVPGRAR